jgi:hypothetical protein
MAIYNDIDSQKWQEYIDVWTDSLWQIDRRDNSGAHSGAYHGNFKPQIPRQLLTRYTKRGDFVLDPFMGSGTTLIEAQRMERNSIGIELQANIANEALERIRTETRDGVIANAYIGDSRFVNLQQILAQNGTQRVQFVILHPPYWDIVKFSDNPNDLSALPTIGDFIIIFKHEYIFVFKKGTK